MGYQTSLLCSTRWLSAARPTWPGPFRQCKARLRGPPLTFKKKKSRDSNIPSDTRFRFARRSLILSPSLSHSCSALHPEILALGSKQTSALILFVSFQAQTLQADTSSVPAPANSPRPRGTRCFLKGAPGRLAAADLVQLASCCL